MSIQAYYQVSIASATNNPNRMIYSTILYATILNTTVFKPVFSPVMSIPSLT